MVTGAPGAVLLYAVLALAVLPATDRSNQLHPAGEELAGWFPIAWAVLWVGGALLQLLPAQIGTTALLDQTGSTDGVPGWLAGLHHSTGGAVSHASNALFIALVATMILVGLSGLAGQPWRTVAAVIGSVVAIAFWLLGQNVGELYSGQATAPNTGPVIVVMAMVLARTTPHHRSM